MKKTKYTFDGAAASNEKDVANDFDFKDEGKE